MCVLYRCELIFNYFQMLQAFLPSMIEKNHGHIVALSSITGLVGIPYLAPYSATKHAVRGKFFMIYLNIAIIFLVFNNFLEITSSI